MSDKYILADDGKTPVAVDDLMQWGMWMEKGLRHVGDDEINGNRVSTVFLGLDHSFLHGTKPILWETIIFSPTDVQLHIARYSTFEEALAGHRRAITMVAT